MLRWGGRGRSAMVRVVRQALSAHEGDVLCFLPGAGEIRRVQTLLEDTPDCDVLPLYGVPSPSPAFDRSSRCARCLVMISSV
jgi:HrpA-like RNA helicase